MTRPTQRRTAVIPFLAAVGLAAVAAGAAMGPSVRPAGAAPAADPCVEPVHREFDFWIGHWDVAQEFPQPDGSLVRLPARSTVTRELRGCALLERWRGQVQYFWEGMSAPDSLYGLSVRSWDAVDGVWRIHWMDTRGPRRWITGGSSGTFADGVGTFLSPPNAEGWSSNRIRFHGIRPDTVEWDLAFRRAPDEPWRVVWRMRFLRRGAAGVDGPGPEEERE